MALVKRTERFLPTLPPFQASLEMRQWLREEFDRMSLTGNATLEAIDALRAAPRMFLVGDADDFNLDTTPSKFVNYAQDGSIGDVPIEPNPVTGDITIPKDGVYQMVTYAYGLQPSVTQNETIRLLIDVDGNKGIVMALDVLSNQTEDRALAATLSRFLPAGSVLSMWMEATGNLGMLEVQQTSFEIVLLTSVDVEQQTLLNMAFFP